jgi:hypothetical protein
MPDDGFSLKLKNIASNKTDINVVVFDGLYFPFTIPHTCLEFETH